VSTDLSTLRIDWSGVRGSLAELMADDEKLDCFFSGAFARLEELSGEFARRSESWSGERTEWQSQLERRNARIAELTEDLARVRAELAEVRKQSQSERLPPAVGENDSRLQQEMLDLQAERASWENDRSLLESELETVRSRAAELAESLAEQKQQLLREHALWSEELTRIRRLVEVLLQQRAALESAAPTESRSSPAAPRTNGDRADDAVLQSVVSQFEMLQRDMARRRGKA
jgi:chromosome segregation ATPase